MTENFLLTLVILIMQNQEAPKRRSKGPNVVFLVIEPRNVRDRGAIGMDFAPRFGWAPRVTELYIIRSIQANGFEFSAPLIVHMAYL